MSRPDLTPGAPVRLETTKWPDRPHWQFVGRWLGSDDHGDWIGYPRGTHHRRPGYAFDSKVDSVTLVPHSAWHLATFQEPGVWNDLYVDIATPVVWDGDVLRAVDLDLDIIRMSSEPGAPSPPAYAATSRGPGEVFVDDEDEFAENQVLLGYPAEVVAAALSACDDVLARIRAGAPPYDGTHRRWLERLAVLTRPGARPGEPPGAPTG